MPVAINEAALQRISAAELAFLTAEREWHTQARPKQILPVDAWRDVRGQECSRGVALSGRGFGKTLMGASWVRRECGLYPGIIVHAIAATYSDLRGVMFEGPSGLRAVIPEAMVQSLTYSPYPEMRLKNGSIIRGFSSETPDRLRGPQCSRVWGDELASWYKPEENISNIDMSTRIRYKLPDGSVLQPKRFYTTTPRPLQWLAEMIERDTLVIRGSTYENRENLAEDFFKQLEQYEGTAIGRQEIHGEILDISEAAIIKRSWLKLWTEPDLPWLEFIMVSMDTAFTEKTFNKDTFEADPTACSVWGVFKWNKRWNLLLLECWEDYLGFPELVDKAKKEMKAIYGQRTQTLFKPMVGKDYVQTQVKRPDLLIIEDKGSGISLRQTLSNEGIDSYPYNPGKADKLARLHSVSHLPHAGRIWLLESTKKKGEPRNWTEPLLSQLCTFSGPGTTKHDDFVDSCTQAWRVFADRYVSGGVGQVIPDPDAQQLPEFPDYNKPIEYVPGEDDGPRNDYGQQRAIYD